VNQEKLKKVAAALPGKVRKLADYALFKLGKNAQHTTQKSVGNIAANSSVKVPLVLIASSETAVGTCNIPITFTYQDALQRPSVDTLYVGPVSVLEAGSQYRLTLEPIATVEIGSQAAFPGADLAACRSHRISQDSQSVDLLSAQSHPLFRGIFQ